MLYISNQICFLQRDCIRQKYLRNKSVLWRSQFSKNKIPHVPKRMYWIETIICCYFFGFPFPAINMFFLFCFKDDGEDEEELCIVYYSVGSVHVCYSCLHILLFTSAHLPFIISIIIIIIIIVIITTTTLSSSSSSLSSL